MIFTIVIAVGVLLGGIAGLALWGAAAFFVAAAAAMPVQYRRVGLQQYEPAHAGLAGSLTRAAARP